jgi:putative restriction endonuclease
MQRDALVRTAAFRFLEERTKLSGEGGSLRRALLQQGFEFEGQRVPLLGPKGIFKPAVLSLAPLSITTVPVVEGQERPYDDAVGADGLLRYRYRGLDPQHPDNVGLRRAMQLQLPLVYFHGVVPGLYVPVWPVYMVGDDPVSLTFTVSVDERRFVSIGATIEDSSETDIRRRYTTRLVNARLHQAEFRERVVKAYRYHCAVCRLKRTELLEAAHILPDSTPQGVPSVRNGVALCKLHHAAFDYNIMGITPDRVIQIRDDVLAEVDGPMLVHGLQGFHGRRLWIPAQVQSQPDPNLLRERYETFLAAR